MSKLFKYNKTGKSALAVLLTSLIFFLSALSVSPDLHKLIHSDADAAGHNCAITLFAKGHVNAAAPATFLGLTAVLLGSILLLSEAFSLPQAAYRYSASRAPPR